MRSSAISQASATRGLCPFHPSRCHTCSRTQTIERFQSDVRRRLRCYHACSINLPPSRSSTNVPSAIKNDALLKSRIGCTRTCRTGSTRPWRLGVMMQDQLAESVHGATPDLHGMNTCHRLPAEALSDPDIKERPYCQLRGGAERRVDGLATPPTATPSRSRSCTAGPEYAVPRSSVNGEDKDAPRRA